MRTAIEVLAIMFGVAFYGGIIAGLVYVEIHDEYEFMGDGVSGPDMYY